MFKPENKLEELLIKSSNEPAYRPQFYEEFLKSEVFILGHGINNSQQDTFTPGDQIQAMNVYLNEKSYLIMFSSLVRLQQYIKQEEKYIKIKVVDFLNLTKGAELLLNFGSEYGKEFTKNEISKLLDGSIWVPDQSYEIKEATQVLIGQPANYPQKLVDSLKILFNKTKEIKKAYLCHFYNPKSNELPHILIGIEVTKNSNWNKIISQVGIVTKGITNEIVDFIRVNKIEKESETINYYLVNNTKSFYSRGFF